MTSAAITARNQIKMSQVAFDEGRKADAHDLLRRAQNNLKKDGEWYTKPQIQTLIIGLMNRAAE